MKDLSAPAARWVYEGVWAVLSGLFRVQREPPALPAAPGTEMLSLRPCEGWLRRRKLLFWFGLTAVDLALLLGWIVLYANLPTLALWLAPIWLAVMVLPDIVAYAAIHLRYDTTWYILSDRSMRIRRGIWTIHETTITYENVQNVRVMQGPLERYFGFSDLVVETAGGSGSSVHDGRHGAGGGGHVGLLEGLEHAADVRDSILARARDSRSAGLGDEIGHEPVAPTRDGHRWTGEHVEALRAIADAAAELRRERQNTR